MRSILISENTTLLAALLNNGYSRTKVKQLLKYRAVQVDGTMVSHLQHPLKAGETLTIASEKEAAARPVDCPGIPIVFEDADILVIDKPAGLLTIASASEKSNTAFFKVSACLKARPQGQDRVFVVHRLDQGASGLLLFAKNETAQHGLQKTWPEAVKKFLAVIEGQMQQASGTVTGYLSESKIHRMYTTTHANEGKYAESHYQILRACGQYSLVEVQLITARKNQLRVHLADLGHPVAGDKKYGAKTDPIKRLAMHASFLAFRHPTTGEPMEFSLAMPRKFANLLKAQPSAATDGS
jgi:23S rRNA pseudouridine1911/1915/1917 synthase